MTLSEELIIGNSSGLCNRIRVLLSWIPHINGRTTIFHWPINAACNEKFENLFMPIDGVKFTTKNKPHINKTIENRRLSIKDLQPQESVRKIVSESKPNGQYAAVHVRRTDIVKVHKKFKIQPPSDEDFFRFLDQFDGMPLFIATDNKSTQQKFMNRYGSRISITSRISSNGSRTRPARSTKIKFALADLYVCSDAAHFMGTTCSSFTGEILKARKQKKDK